jgi:hypothetical protein
MFLREVLGKMEGGWGEGENVGLAVEGGGRCREGDEGGGGREAAEIKRRKVEVEVQGEGGGEKS